MGEKKKEPLAVARMKLTLEFCEHFYEVVWVVTSVWLVCSIGGVEKWFSTWEKRWAEEMNAFEVEDFWYGEVEGLEYSFRVGKKRSELTRKGILLWRKEKLGWAKSWFQSMLFQGHIS